MTNAVQGTLTPAYIAGPPQTTLPPALASCSTLCRSVTLNLGKKVRVSSLPRRPDSPLTSPEISGLHLPVMGDNYLCDYLVCLGPAHGSGSTNPGKHRCLHCGLDVILPRGRHVLSAGKAFYDCYYPYSSPGGAVTTASLQDRRPRAGHRLPGPCSSKVSQSRFPSFIS